jgi:hypothetical protein
MKIIKGSRFNDLLSADKLVTSKVLGLNGNDILQDGGTTKRHILDGGPGDDEILFSSYTTKALGGDGNDKFWGMAGVAGSIGNDAIISGGNGNDDISFGPAFAEVSKGWKVFGGSGDDKIYYQANAFRARDNIINGGAGNDQIFLDGFGYYEKTSVRGGRGDDLIQFSSIPKARHTKNISGGPGVDTLRFYPNADYKLSGDSKSATIIFQQYTLNGVGYRQKVSFKGIDYLVIGNSAPISL